MDIRAWQAAEWAAFGAVGALLVYVVLGVVALVQLRESQKLRKLEYRPYVIVDFYFRGQSVFLEIRNMGRNPAQEIRVSFDKELETPNPRRAINFSIFDQPIPMMAPGRTIRLPLGYGPDFFREGQPVPLAYEARLTYKDVSGTGYFDPPLILDLTPFRYAVATHDDLSNLVSAVRAIRDSHNKWTSHSGLKVVATDHLRTERRVARVDHWYDIRHAYKSGGIRAVVKSEVQRIRRLYG